MNDQEILDSLRANVEQSRSWEGGTPVQTSTLRPVPPMDQTNNALRPSRLDEVIGQDTAVRVMATIIERALDRQVALDHILLVGPSGTGKSTFSHVIANEMGVDVWKVEAPVSIDTLLALREAVRDQDIIRVEEIHQQAIQERRGRQSATQPEVLYEVMEDRTITTGTEVLQFPEVTIIGTTTDEGMLPEPFLNRFPFRPRLERYNVDQMKYLAEMNADKLGLDLTPEARDRIANASRNIPRQLNNLMKNALALGDCLDEDLAVVVIRDVNGLTDDGLTRDMQDVLTFLYTRAKRSNMQGDIKYQASVNTIATAIGKSRDTKAVALYVEPHLIEQGYVQVGHGGRLLTDLGINRAKELLNA